MKKNSKSNVIDFLEYKNQSRLYSDPEVLKKVSRLYERLIDEEGFSEEQALQIVMARAAKQDGDIDETGNEAELNVKKERPVSPSLKDKHLKVKEE